MAVFPTVLLGNYRLLVLDPNFIYSRSHRTKIPVTVYKIFIIQKVNVNKHTVQMRDLTEWQLI